MEEGGKISCARSPSGNSLHQLHRFGVPPNHSAAFVAKVAEQRRTGCAVAKHSILHDGLPGANRGKEISEVIVAVTVSFGRHIFLVSQPRLSRRVRARVLLPVLLSNALLHRLGEASNNEAGLGLERRAAYDEGVAR